MIIGSIQEEDITIINTYAPNIGAPQYVRQMLTSVKGEINNNTIIEQGAPQGRRKSGAVRKDLFLTGDPGPPQQPPRGPRAHCASNILVVRPDGSDSQCPEDEMTVQLPEMGSCGCACTGQHPGRTVSEASQTPSLNLGSPWCRYRGLCTD